MTNDFHYILMYTEENGFYKMGCSRDRGILKGSLVRLQQFGYFFTTYYGHIKLKKYRYILE